MLDFPAPFLFFALVCLVHLPSQPRPEITNPKDRHPRLPNHPFSYHHEAQMGQDLQASSEAMQNSLLRFPNEILYTICESMLQSADGNPDRKSLGCLSRTCSLLRKIAAPALFRRLEVEHPLSLFSSLRSIIEHSQTDLIRSANLSYDTRNRCGAQDLHSPRCPYTHQPTYGKWKMENTLSRSEVRVPINSGSLCLGEKGQKAILDNLYPIHATMPTHDRAFTRRVGLQEKHFQPLPQLQELDLDFTTDERNQVGRYPGHISWIIQRAPNLVALRLIRNKNLNSTAIPWMCSTVEWLSLIDCCTPPRDISRLVASCPQLRHFKMMRRKPAARSHGPGWECAKGRQIASVLLATLAQPDEDSDAAPSITGFTSLETLSISRQCLFEPHSHKARDHETRDRDVNVLVNLVAGCPTLENLHILQTEDQCLMCTTALYRALKALYDDIDGTQVPGLREIKLWHFDSHSDWTVDKWDSDGPRRHKKEDPCETLVRRAGMSVTDLIPLFESLGIIFKYELPTGKGGHVTM
ncbi:hypothetical protein QBC37DRAFT_406748 [Rhypophila decipiens]|uniref:F-box domain-containing protein n=1 Tax=Rhypophila decipiens TaxID=261697 RepID=A0AAN7B3G9_9PEZI|nr:hypothetical protein QBC37DRAFT_406748 [Rhypophila decipiens]